MVSPSRATKPSETLATKWIAALIAIACLAFVGFQTSRILDHRAELWHDEQIDTANLTNSLIKHAELTVRTADALLIATVFGLEHGLFKEDNLHVLQTWFAEEVGDGKQFNTFMIIDHDGKLVVGSMGSGHSVDLSDRDHFIYHRTHEDRELHIGAPARGRVTGRWFIPITRRFNRMDGRFGGVVVAALNPKFFLEAYQQLDVGKNGAIMLASLDRKLLVRRPFVEADVGRDLPGSLFTGTYQPASGNVDVISPIDGVRRILSYERSTKYPFFITVAKDLDETLAPWRRDTLNMLLETGSIVGLLMLLGVIIWRVTRRLADKAATLHEANDRFDIAIKTMSHGLSLFDANERLVIVNARFLDMYRLGDGMVRPGMHFSELLQIHHARGDVVTHTTVAGGSKDSLPILPYRCVLKHGNIIAIRRSVTPGGGWVSIHEDVTEEERAAKALVAARDAAEAASRAKSDFLAIMSHEIRTPMAGMMGMIHLLAETQLDQEQQELAATAQESARNLLVVVNDILDFSKLEAGEVMPEAIDFNIENPIRSVVALLAPKARGQGLSLTAALAPELPRILKGDPSRVSQILLNLVGNAIKFTETGAVTIAVSHRIVQDDGIELRIAVTDTGIGLAAEALKFLFNPFTQADTSVSRKYGGTGLGLAICKRLCETMGGSIGVESQPGTGSTFWFTVLCRPGNDVPDVAAPPLAPLAVVDAAALCILVAEDNAIVRTLISKLLARRGYRADLVCNGREAVEAVQRKRYDLVLMDMQMPEMDGISATRRIRASNGPERDLPIIALTANATVGQREICLAAGMNSFLTKPIQPDGLYDAISRWGVVTGDQVTTATEFIS